MSGTAEFLATIVTQSGGKKSGVLSSDAATVVEKFKHPTIENVSISERGKSMAEALPEKGEEKAMRSLNIDEFFPYLDLSGKQLPELVGKEVGEKVCLYFEGVVDRYAFESDSEGREENRYTIKLVTGMVKKEEED